MKKLFLLDAYAIIYRAYYAFIRNPRINSKGVNTSAIYGFINTLEEVLKRENPTHIAIAFDPKGGTFRHKIDPNYKAQREETPEDIRTSIPIIKNIIAAYNIPIFEVENYEADDVIGTIAKKAEKEGFEVYMLTPDKDYGQLVSEHIFMYRPKHKGGYEKMGVEQILTKYGLQNTLQVIDLLGLMGDSSDNVPGCPGVGEKTAIKLLNQFQSIDNLLNNTDQLTGSLQKKVIENADTIRHSKFLVTIKTDVPLIFEPTELQCQQADEELLKNIFEELEFRSLIKRTFDKNEKNTQQTHFPNGQLSLFDTPPSSPTTISQNIQNLQQTKTDYILVDSQEKRAQLIAELLKQQSVCFDTETTNIDVFKADLVGIAFAYKKNNAYYLPMPIDRDKTHQILEELKPFFDNQNIEKIGQNLKYDLLVLAQYGIQVSGKLFDTMIAHYLIQPELRHGMDYLADVYLNYKTIKYDDIVGKGKQKISIRQVEVDRLKDYAAEDADITLQLKSILEKELKEKGLEKLFYDIEIPLMRVLVKIEQHGVRIDSQALNESSTILTEKLLIIENKIIEMAGVPFNVSSPMQVGEVLFDHLKLSEKAKKTKTGQYSTSEDILQKLRSKHPIIDKILEYRGLKKLLSTYIDALPKLVNPTTGRIHTSYNQTIASTGRLSSTNPNMQNIPVRNELGREIRKAFIPFPNHTFLSADYSQIELRIMAHLSQDTNMIAAFRSGKDIHTATAANIYKIEIEEVTTDMRRKAKTANFGIIYGISTFGLAERLNIPRTEAKELIDGYFQTYPQIKTYMDKAIEDAKTKGYVTTIYGRKRYLSDINSNNRIVRGFAERNAINAPIQGSAADIIKIAMVNIQNRLEEKQLDAKMIMQVHDELNFSVPNELLNQTIELVKYEMENVIQLSVPLLAEYGTGDNWLVAH